jgi:twitching motility protein PilT
MEIKKLLKIAAENGASDLHLVKGLPPIIRIDGRLLPIDQAALSASKMTSEISAPASSTGDGAMVFSDDGRLVAPKKGVGKAVETASAGYDGKALSAEELNKMIMAMITKEQYSRFLGEQDLDFSYAVDNYRFRVNLSFERENMKLVARVISDQKPSLDDLGMPKTIENLLGLKQGLILLTGPTGCGKSTTLAAMINHLNDNYNYNIITLEDPIEYLFESNKSIITQRQLTTDMPTFASGLKHILRQDPNVVMVGEMRDLETISTAITLAETGHLVLATLHTYSASQTVDRIIDTFPPYQQNQVKSQLSMILSAVISQRLLPKNGGGRIAAREIMIRNAAISNLIREQKIAQIKNVIETSYKEGMVTFGRSVKELYEAGLITQEVAQEQLSDPTLLN